MTQIVMQRSYSSFKFVLSTDCTFQQKFSTSVFTFLWVTFQKTCFWN